MNIADLIKQTGEKVYTMAKDYLGSEELVRSHLEQLGEKYKYGLFPCNPNHDPRKDYKK